MHNKDGNKESISKSFKGIQILLLYSSMLNLMLNTNTTCTAQNIKETNAWVVYRKVNAI